MSKRKYERKPGALSKKHTLSPKLRQFLSERLHYLTWKWWKEEKGSIRAWEAEDGINPIMEKIDLYLQEYLLKIHKKGESNHSPCESRLLKAAQTCFQGKYKKLVGSGLKKNLFAVNTWKKHIGHLQNYVNSDGSSYWTHAQKYSDGQEVSFHVENITTDRFMELILRVAVKGCPSFKECRRKGISLQGHQVKKFPARKVAYQQSGPPRGWEFGNVEPNEIKEVNPDEKDELRDDGGFLIIDQGLWRSRKIKDEEKVNLLEYDYYLRFHSDLPMLLDVLANGLAIPPEKTLRIKRPSSEFMERRLSFSDFLDNDEGCLVVLGNGGEGKSTYLLWQTFEFGGKANYFWIDREVPLALKTIISMREKNLTRDRIVIIVDEPGKVLQKQDIEELSKLLATTTLHVGRDIMFMVADREFLYENWDHKDEFEQCFSRIDVGVYEPHAFSRKYLDRVARVLEMDGFVSAQKDRLIGLVLQQFPTLSLVEKALELISLVDLNNVTQSFKYEWTDWEQVHGQSPLKFLYFYVAFFYQFGIRPPLNAFIGHHELGCPTRQQLYKAVQVQKTIILENRTLSLRHAKIAEWFFDKSKIPALKFSHDMMGAFFAGFSDPEEGEELLLTLASHKGFLEKMKSSFYQKAHSFLINFQNLAEWFDSLIEQCSYPEPASLLHAFEAYLQADNSDPTLILLEEFEQKYEGHPLKPKFLKAVLLGSLKIKNLKSGRKYLDLIKKTQAISSDPQLIPLEAEILYLEEKRTEAFAKIWNGFVNGEFPKRTIHQLVKWEEELTKWLRLNPDNISSLSQESRTHLLETLIGSACGYLISQILLEKEPESQREWTLYGKWQSNAPFGKRKEAGICFFKAYQLNPASTETRANYLTWLRERYSETGKVEFATKAKELFSQFGPDLAQLPFIILQIFADLHLTEWKLQEVDSAFEKGITLLQKILERDPQHEGALLQMGKWKVEKYSHSHGSHHFKEAELHLKGLIHLQGSRADVYTLLGELYRQKWRDGNDPGYLTPARAYLQEAIDQDPWDVEPRMLFIEFLKWQGMAKISSNYARDCFIQIPGEMRFLQLWWDLGIKQRHEREFAWLIEGLRESEHPEDCLITLRRLLWENEKRPHLFLKLCDTLFKIHFEQTESLEEPAFLSAQVSVILDIHAYYLAQQHANRIKAFLQRNPNHPAWLRLKHEVELLEQIKETEGAPANLFFVVELNSKGEWYDKTMKTAVIIDPKRAGHPEGPGEYFYARIHKGDILMGQFPERRFF